MTKKILSFLLRYHSQKSYPIILYEYAREIKDLLNIFWDLGIIYGYKEIRRNGLHYFVIYPKRINPTVIKNKSLKFISLPSNRKFITLKKLSILLEKNSNFDIYLISTNEGLLEANVALKKKLGGELICKFSI